MRVVAFIPIKTNNERTPGKNTIQFFDGTPLMHFIQRSLLNVDCIEETYVFSSDETIRDYCLEGVSFLPRISTLDTAQTTPADIINAFINQIDANIYITAHATSPFVPSAAIADCVNAVLSGNYDSAFTASIIKKLLWSESGNAYNFDPMSVPRTQDLPPLYAEVGAAYVFTKKVFLDTGRRVGVNPYIRVVSDIEATDIDYPEDFEMANLIYKEIILKNAHNSTT